MTRKNRKMATEKFDNTLKEVLGEWWSTGVMEYWSGGVAEEWVIEDDGHTAKE